MKIKSRAALLLACVFALTPLAACNRDIPNEGEGNGELIQPVPPPDTLPPDNATDEPPVAQPPEQPGEPQTPDVPAPVLPPETNSPPAAEDAEDPPEKEPTVSTKPVAPDPPKVKTTDYILVQTNGLNIRTGAGTSYNVLATADKGSLLVYAGKSGDWYKTRYQNKTAYVHSSHAKIFSVPVANENIENVIKRGFDFLGVKYVYGATRYHDGKGNKLSGFTTTAFDCSSYMQYIFLYGAGVLLDMTTRTQVLQGTAVARADIKRGDLLFFTNASRYNNTGIERVGHVALYLGDNYILHTASDYARAEQITSARWNYYLTARRML